MPAPSWENMDVFLQTDDNGGFATPAVIFFANGTTRNDVPVIFDDPYMNADLGEYELDASQPRVGSEESNFAGVQRGDTIEVDGQIFDVMGLPQSDGNGWATVPLGARYDDQP